MTDYSALIARLRARTLILVTSGQDIVEPDQDCQQAADVLEQVLEAVDEAQKHLGNVLSLLADLDEGDRSRAFDAALELYNSSNPTAIVEPTGIVTTYIVHKHPVLGIGELTKRSLGIAGIEDENRQLQEAVEEAERVIGPFAEVIDWFGRLQKMDRDVSIHSIYVHTDGKLVGGRYALKEPAFRAAAEWKLKHGTGR